VSWLDPPLREADCDAADLLDRPADEVRRVRVRLISVFGGGALAFCWMVASMAKASMTSETWRCQPCQLLVSLWSRPSSFFAVSNASSMAQRCPSTVASVSIVVPAGHQVVK
jgi:hypothetical protein